MLRAIIEDKATKNPDPTLEGDIGYLPHDLGDFFHEHRTLTDDRSERLEITYRENTVSKDMFQQYIMGDVYRAILRQHVIDPDTPTGVHMIEILLGDMVNAVNGQKEVGSKYRIDRAMSMTINYDQDTLESDEINYIASMSSVEKNAIFNIAEKFLLGVTYQQTLDEIEAEMTDEELYRGYKKGSFKLTNRRRRGHIYSNVDIHILVQPVIEFTIQRPGGVSLDIELYYSRDTFEREYLHSAIIQVVPPTDVKFLLDPNMLDGKYDAIFESRDQLHQDLIDKIVQGKSYRGLYKYTVEYVSPVDGSKHDYIFSILYRGVEPSILNMKNAIKQYFNDSGHGTLDQWKERFPTIYISNMFYIYPLWDETFSTTNKEVFKSILTDTKKKAIQNTIRDENIFVNTSTFELLNVAYNTSYSVVVSDKANLTDKKLVELYPDYSRISASHPMFNIMSEDTKQFIVDINKAMAKANGESNELSTDMLNGYEYVKFYNSDREFYVLTKDSYKNKLII